MYRDIDHIRLFIRFVVSQKIVEKFPNLPLKLHFIGQKLSNYVHLLKNSNCIEVEFCQMNDWTILPR